MEMYNLDGSRGAMCGNGIRCVAKYAYDYGIVNKTDITVATGSGIKTLHLTLNKDNKGGNNWRQHGCSHSQSMRDSRRLRRRYRHQRTDRGGWKNLCLYRSFHGKSHAIIYMEEIDSLDLEKIDSSLKNHPLFPDRVNTEFVKVLDSHTVQMRVWERGSGETLACGTGACAVAVASILNGHVDGEKPVTVKLLGGDLEIFWDREENLVYMTAPPQRCLTGKSICVFGRLAKARRYHRQAFFM